MKGIVSLSRCEWITYSRLLRVEKVVPPRFEPAALRPTDPETDRLTTKPLSLTTPRAVVFFDLHMFPAGGPCCCLLWLFCGVVFFVVKPEFKIEPPEAFTVEQGQVVTLDCVAEGEPLPDMTWHKGRIQNMIHSEDRIMILGNNSLRFETQVTERIMLVLLNRVNSYWNELNARDINRITFYSVL